MLTSNSLLVLYTHVKTGRWASVMPAKLAEASCPALPEVATCRQIRLAGGAALGELGRPSRLAHDPLPVPAGGPVLADRLDELLDVGLGGPFLGHDGGRRPPYHSAPGSLWLPPTHYIGGFTMPSHTHATPQPPVQATVLKVKTHVKAGGVIMED